MTEAQSAESRADFIHKVNISLKEARESLYWLRLLHVSESVPETRIIPMMKETDEIVAIISTILIKTKRGQ